MKLHKPTYHSEAAELQGAERTLQLPHELQRFKELPMSVTYSLSESSSSSSRVLQLSHLNESQVSKLMTGCRSFHSTKFLL